MINNKNQELTSTATPEPIHNNTDIIEIDESTAQAYIADAGQSSAAA